MKNKIKCMILVLPILFCLSGCITTGKQVILTSDEQMWVIPKGGNFQAIQDPKKPAQTFTAADDLAVMYKGKLLELVKEADAKAFIKADQAKTNGLILGAVISVLTLLGGLLGKGIFDKIFKPK